MHVVYVVFVDNSMCIAYYWRTSINVICYFSVIAL